MEKESLVVSACFLKDGFKYDGTNNYNKDIENLKSKYNLILVCPEVFGGLSTPRLASEQHGDKVVMINGKDVTINFMEGAKKSLELAIKGGAKKALLKAKSPSCGYQKVYDGTFTHTLIDGNGVFVKLLIDQGFEIYTEADLYKL